MPVLLSVILIFYLNAPNNQPRNSQTDKQKHTEPCNHRWSKWLKKSTGSLNANEIEKYLQVEVYLSLALLFK
jgi:hypothetical protein